VPSVRVAQVALRWQAAVRDEAAGNFQLNRFVHQEVGSESFRFVRSPSGLVPRCWEVAELAPSRDLQWSRFFREDPETRVRLQGVPDDILRMADGATHIVDYKTARLTETQDELMPVYEVQLNGYAYIAEATGTARSPSFR